jgi:hypothetical protein
LANFFYINEKENLLPRAKTKFIEKLSGALVGTLYLSCELLILLAIFKHIPVDIAIGLLRSTPFIPKYKVSKDWSKVKLY